jgi:hypothetical protein
MPPPHCGQTKLIIEEMMLALDSPGIVSIVRIVALRYHKVSEDDHRDGCDLLLRGIASAMPIATLSNGEAHSGHSINGGLLSEPTLGEQLASDGPSPLRHG